MWLAQNVPFRPSFSSKSQDSEILVDVHVGHSRKIIFTPSGLLKNMLSNVGISK